MKRMMSMQTKKMNLINMNKIVKESIFEEEKVEKKQDVKTKVPRKEIFKAIGLSKMNPNQLKQLQKKLGEL